MTDERFGQFHRLEQMIGREKLLRLQNSGVILAGLGAVGSYTLEALARAGIGRFRLIDCDQVSPSNINRQILADWETVGRRKTTLAKERVLRINPRAEVETLDLVINAETVPQVLENGAGKYRLLIDAIDSLSSKVELLRRSVEWGMPRLASMGAALKTDLRQIRFGTLTEVRYCRLSAMLRKRLRRFGINTDEIEAVWSEEPTREEQISGKLAGAVLPQEESEDEKPQHGRRRSTLGSLPTVPGVFGLWLAHTAIERLSADEKE